MLPTAWTFALNTESTCDWEGEEWNVPVDAVVSWACGSSSRCCCRNANMRTADTLSRKHPETTAMMQGNLVVMVGALLLAACSGPSAPEPDAKQPATGTEIVQLGGPATGAGTLTADAGEIPSGRSRQSSTRSPATRPTRAGATRSVRTSVTSTCTRRWSADAGGSGTTLGPEEATRFARGEEVISTSGQPAKLGTAARLGRDHRSLRRHGHDHRDQGRQSRDDGRPDAQALARHVQRPVPWRR